MSDSNTLPHKLDSFDTSNMCVIFNGEIIDFQTLNETTFWLRDYSHQLWAVCVIDFDSYLHVQMTEMKV